MNRGRLIALAAVIAAVVIGIAVFGARVGRQSLQGGGYADMASQSVARNDFAGAIRYQQQAVQSEPQSRAAQFQLAYLLLHERRTSEADPILLSLAKGDDAVGRAAQRLLAKTRGRYTIH